MLIYFNIVMLFILSWCYPGICNTQSHMYAFKLDELWRSVKFLV